SSRTDADKHVLYATSDKHEGQVAVDLKVADTWKAGAAGKNSLLDSKNTFEDVQAAHYEQDARIAQLAKTQGIAAIQANGTIKLDKIQAAATGALNLDANTAGNNGIKKDASDALAHILTLTAADLNTANSAIDDAITKLNKVVEAGKGKTMDTTEAQDAMASHAMIKHLEGIKEGINEKDRNGLKDIIGLTDDTKTNFGRLSLSSTNGKDIVVEATRDYVDKDGKLQSMNVTS
ncbi:hypothetical protein AVBRAN12640_09855, partial [Campylobacter sp. RM12640]|uniref:hypothetical protein n=1 Tax=unclassified Campylobacter TaxID=2593542 RepID=UPI003014A0F8|nr:hypothetical protein [Campylobacter sp. RM12640]MBZ7990150.1 hypothetical protein [Campylobacter sp. RM12635]